MISVNVATDGTRKMEDLKEVFATLRAAEFSNEVSDRRYRTMAKSDANPAGEFSDSVTETAGMELRISAQRKTPSSPGAPGSATPSPPKWEKGESRSQCQRDGSIR